MLQKKKSHPIFLDNGGMKCPRSSCRHEQPSLFDSLAMSRESECVDYLLPVYKCPQCRHLFSAIVPRDLFDKLKKKGLI